MRTIVSEQEFRERRESGNLRGIGSEAVPSNGSPIVTGELGMHRRHPADPGRYFQRRSSASH